MVAISSDEGPGAAWSRNPRANYIMLLLCLTALFNFLDRQIFSILLQSIKNDLQVSDTAMGVLTGGAFALLYVIAGIPMARIADHGSRKRLIAVSLTIWSAMTLVCGLATHYVHLLLARMGVAVGEAGSMPATYSLIPDLLPLNKRPGAVGLLYFSGSVGIGLSLFVGGLLNVAIGWRGTLIAVALPGFLLALLIQLTVQEPQRQEATAERQPVLDALRDLWRYPSFRCVSLYAIFGAFVGYAIVGWAPTFLIRVHKMAVPEVGFWIGISLAFGSGVGSLVAGRIANRLIERDVRLLFYVIALSTGLALPLGLLFVFAPTAKMSVIAFFIYSTVYGAQQPVYFTIALILARGRTRGLSTVILTLFQNIGGVALGPVVAGILNDSLYARFGDIAIRYSLAIVYMGLVVALVISLIGTRFIRDDYAKAQKALASA
jgi:MFS family permease